VQPTSFHRAALGDTDTASVPLRIYLFISQRYRGQLAAVAQRQGNNADPTFTDEEVLTIYVFGLIKKRNSITAIRLCAQEHFSEWLPDLPPTRVSIAVRAGRAPSLPRSPRRFSRKLRAKEPENR